MLTNGSSSGWNYLPEGVYKCLRVLAVFMAS